MSIQYSAANTIGTEAADTALGTQDHSAAGTLRSFFIHDFFAAHVALHVDPFLVVLAIPPRLIHSMAFLRFLVAAAHFG